MTTWLAGWLQNPSERVSEPGENAIRIDWRLEEGEKEEKRMGKRRTEIWGEEGEEGEYATEGRNIKAVSELGWDQDLGQKFNGTRIKTWGWLSGRTMCA